MIRAGRLAMLAALLPGCCAAVRADDFAAQCADRAAIERVYHAHRIGVTQPFEQALPRELLEKLVRQDLRKEALLKSAWGVEITPVAIAAEVKRIDTTTRAPEMLAEIKAALGGDPARFAAAFVRPILVERALRGRFDGDDALHAPQRREAELARETLRARKPLDGLRETTWQLRPRPAAEKSEPRSPGVSAPPQQTKAVATGGAYTIEATAQLSQAIPPPHRSGHTGGTAYFDDLDPELQKVLAVQLQKPGDVSAVIETPAGFLVFVARERTPETLRAASLAIPRRSYDDWLAAQLEKIP